MSKFFEQIAVKWGQLAIRRRISSIASGFNDNCDVGFDVASQLGNVSGPSGRSGHGTDMSQLDSISASTYISEARKETSTVEWKLKDFLHLNKVYMLDPGPSILVDAGTTIDLPIKFKFSLEHVYSTTETRSHIWLVTEVTESPPGLENVVCEFSTQLFTDGVKVKELRGSPVTIPINHKNPIRRNSHKFNVSCLIPWDCVYSHEKLLTVKIQISLFARRTEGKADVTNVRETMEKSGRAFSLQIGSLLRTEDEDGEKMFSDVKLILKDDVVVHAHRAILASRSPVFKAMLLADMEESKTGTVKIPDVGSRAMDVVLHHIYTGRVDPSCNQVLEEVIYAAGKYNLPELLEYCDKVMITVCDKENALSLLKVAKMHGLQSAVRDVTNYIKMNSVDILECIIDE